MTNGEIAYLALVLIAFASFVGIVGFISIWSRFPARTRVGASHADIPSSRPHERLEVKRERAEAASDGSVVPRPSRAA